MYTRTLLLLQLQANVDDLKTMSSQLFRNVFVQRYRDVVSDIRSLCMEEIGLWFRRLPSVYLDDSYLKYVGWTLYDRVRCVFAFAVLLTGFHCSDVHTACNTPARPQLMFYPILFFSSFLRLAKCVCTAWPPSRLSLTSIPPQSPLLPAAWSCSLSDSAIVSSKWFRTRIFKLPSLL